MPFADKHAPNYAYDLTLLLVLADFLVAGK